MLCNHEWTSPAGLDHSLLSRAVAHHRFSQVFLGTQPCAELPFFLSLVKEDISLKIPIPQKAKDIEKGGLLAPHVISLSKLLKLLFE